MRKKNSTKKINLNFFVPLGAKLKIHLLFFIVLTAALLGGYTVYFVLAYAAALLHECAHILTAKRLGIKISHIEIQPFGICAKLHSSMAESPSKEILIALAGPLCSACLALALFLTMTYLPNAKSALIQYTFQINLMLALLNLLPALPLDGGRVVKGCFTLAFGCVKAYNITLKISRFFITLLLGGAIWLLLSTQFNFSLLLIGAFLLGNLSAEQKNLTLLAMKELTEHKERFFQRDIHKAICITVRANIPARKILPRFRSSHYFIVHVVDKDAKILKTLTETQIIDALINDSIRVSVGDIT